MSHNQQQSPPLFRPDPPYVRDSATSQAAASKARPRAHTQRELVYRHLVQCGERGATDEEMQIALEMNPSTQRPRRVELVREGAVRLSGLTRCTTSGREAGVWLARHGIDAGEDVITDHDAGDEHR